MQHDFIPAIISLKNANPDEIINKLHEMFSSITTMNENEVIAAYQTLSTAAEMIELTEDKTVLTLLEAMRSQMKGIASRSKRAFGGETALKRFEAVTGRMMESPFSFSIFR